MKRDIVNAMLVLLVVMVTGLAGCGGGGGGGAAATPVATVGSEVWVGSNGQGDTNTTLTKYADGTITATGQWTYNYQGAAVTCQISAGNVTVTGSNVTLTETGTATNPAAPAGYQTSPFTLSQTGTMSGGQGSGSFTITFQTTGWPASITGTWTAQKQSGSGVTDSAVNNIPFSSQLDNYVNGFGKPGIDTITITSIQGPVGATVSNQTNGTYIVSGTYKLGTFNNAIISLEWGGTTNYSLNEEYTITQPGTGTFSVKVNKTSGGSGNLFLSMFSGSSWMFDAVPVNTSSKIALPLTKENNLKVTLKSASWSTGENQEGTIWHEAPWSYFEK